MTDNRYSRGKIYKILCNVTGKCYIGSTCETTLAKRLAQHRCNYKLWTEGKSCFVTSYHILENDNYTISLLEECPCETKDQLRAKERYYIESIECVNKYIPSRTKAEYNKQYNLANKDRAKQYRIDNREKTKHYQAANKEKLAENRRRYREKKKQEKLNELNI